MAINSIFRVIKFLIALSFAIYNPSIKAQINVIPKSLEITNSPKSIKVSNMGSNPEFLTIKLFELKNPGVTPEEEELVPIETDKRPMLMASPFKVSLGPQQEKRISLSILEDVKEEKVYRLNVTPVGRFKILRQLTSTLQLKVGYSILIRQLPSHSISKWEYQCHNNGITLNATGNVRVMLTELRSYNKPIDSFNLYPNSPRILNTMRLSGMANDIIFNITCNNLKADYEQKK